VRAKIGASVNAWVFPGNTISSLGALAFGVITLTVDTAAAVVSCLRSASARLRLKIPKTISTKNNTAAIPRPR